MKELPRLRYPGGIDADGERVTFTKTEQVRMCGNAVPPQFSAALVRANCADLRFTRDPRQTTVVGVAA